MIFVLAVVAVYMFIILGSIIEGATNIKKYLNKRKTLPILNKFFIFILDLLCFLLVCLFFSIIVILL
jgi:hypothetical protein